MYFTINLKAYIETSIEKAFDFGALNPKESLKTFTGYGFIPGIKGYEVIKGDGINQGAVRSVETTDGQKIEESIVTIERPTRFVYETKGFGFPFSLIVKAARGEFVYTPSGAGVIEEWTYRYTLTSFLAYPLALLVLGVFFRKAMKINQQNKKEILESR